MMNHGRNDSLMMMMVMCGATQHQSENDDVDNDVCDVWSNTTRENDDG